MVPGSRNGGLGSAPPSMEDSRVLDAASLRQHYEVTISDADSAYIQAYLDSAYETWVELPVEYWEPHWHNQFRRPMCRLNLALYGHADSGGGIGRRSHTET